MKGIGLKEEIDHSGHTVEKNALEGMGSDWIILIIQGRNDKSFT